MDTPPFVPANPLPAPQPLHDPSAADISRIADTLMRDAVAAAHGTMPPVPAEAAMAPPTFANPLPVPPRTAIPTAAVPFARANPSVALPTTQPAFSSPSAVVPSVGSPATDYSGLKAFVGHIRGLDHLELPRVLDEGSPAALAPSSASATAPVIPTASGFFDIDAVRRDFPILREKVHGEPLAWFDNAATTQKPQAVIDALSHFYAHDNSNIHRGAHTLAARATDAYEHARRTIADFLGASSPDEIIYVRGCTEGVNLCANILAPGLSRGDEIVLTELEHHANIVPWQMVAERTGAVIRVVPIDDRGDVIVEAYAKLLSPLTKVVSISHASNSLGTILPVELMTGMAKARGARVLVDGAQSVSHFPVDVRRIGCDFYVFSGHKIFGPTGIGAVFMTKEAQGALPPWQGGGNMIKDVTFAHTTYAEPPAKFEAGTPNIADAIGLGAALDYVTALGRERIAAYEHELLHYATGRLTAIDGLRLIGTSREKVGVLSFVIDGLDPIEIGKALDREGIAVRAGHHCAQPSLRRYGLEATVRPSLAFYNTHGEIDRLTDAIAAITRSR
ncbi:MAG: SufS family cysteine desulfurase [Planctomycetes bacterium]|nr:SufS family cysteine desulfurase [Planctomycetota bacterium]